MRSLISFVYYPQLIPSNSSEDTLQNLISMENCDLTATARGRLAVLSAHLSASPNRSGSFLDFSGCSADVAPPTNLKGTLTLIDERTGIKYQVQVSQDGTIKATDLKKVTFTLQPIQFSFNSTMDFTVNCESTINVKSLRRFVANWFGILCLWPILKAIQKLVVKAIGISVWLKLLLD